MAGTITHSWNGTILTITSDAGTSSADLQGATGCRGPQGRPGVVYDEEGKILCSDLASKEYVDAGDANIDNRTLIRNEDGKLTTSIGGYIVSHVEGQLTESSSEVYITPVEPDIWINPNGLIWNNLVDNQTYNYFITLNTGDVIELKNVETIRGEWQTIENDYFSQIKIGTQFYATPTSYTDWSTEKYTITSFEIWTTGNTVYKPIDAYAIPVDNDTIVIDNFNQLTTGANVVVESRMAEYVEEQIDLAKVGGDDPAAVLANYYTKTEVDAMFAALTSSEGVEY